MAQAAAASHAARLAELNVAPEVIAAVPGCTREPPVTGGVRVMSWNILAEGMSYDGFHAPLAGPDDGLSRQWQRQTALTATAIGQGAPFRPGQRRQPFRSHQPALQWPSQG